MVDLIMDELLPTDGHVYLPFIVILAVALVYTYVYNNRKRKELENRFTSSLRKMDEKNETLLRQYKRLTYRLKK